MELNRWHLVWGGLFCCLPGASAVMSPSRVLEHGAVAQSAAPCVCTRGNSLFCPSASESTGKRAESRACLGGRMPCLWKGAPLTWTSPPTPACSPGYLCCRGSGLVAAEQPSGVERWFLSALCLLPWQASATPSASVVETWRQEESSRHDCTLAHRVRERPL